MITPMRSSDEASALYGSIQQFEPWSGALMDRERLSPTAGSEEMPHMRTTGRSMLIAASALIAGEKITHIKPNA
jgi:hypothetical protein